MKTFSWTDWATLAGLALATAAVLIALTLAASGTCSI